MDLMTPTRLRDLKKLIAEDRVPKFYTWKEYRIVRSRAKVRDNHECQHCKREGKYGNYGACHHKLEVREHPDKALLLSNVEIVCKMHHNKLHPEKFSNKPSFTNDEWF